MGELEGASPTLEKEAERSLTRHPHRSASTLVFSNAPSLSTVEQNETLPDANTYQPFKQINDAVLRGVHDALEEAAGELNQPPLQGVVSSLAQALCHINRLGQLSALGTEEEASSSSATRKAPNVRGFRSRILILSASPDSSSQYVAVMNCIFGAQKQVSTTDGFGRRATCDAAMPDSHILAHTGYRD